MLQLCCSHTLQNEACNLALQTGAATVYVYEVDGLLVYGKKLRGLGDNLGYTGDGAFKYLAQHGI